MRFKTAGVFVKSVVLSSLAFACSAAPEDGSPSELDPALGGEAAANPEENDVTALTDPGEPFDRDEYLRFARRTATLSPDSSRFEFLGYVKPANTDIWVHDVKPAASIHELLKDKPFRTDKDEDHDVARGILVSADGRVFIERSQIVDKRVALAQNRPEAGHSQAGSDHAGSGSTTTTLLEPKPTKALLPAPGTLEHGELETEPELGGSGFVADTIFGGDGRSLITSSSYPWRAVGVSLLEFNDDNDSWARGQGSAAMIGPRAALTVAHTITDNGSTFSVLGVAPAARGYSYCGGTGLPYSSTCKFPFGLRNVQWYYWPDAYDGDGIKYDYGVLILEDLNWSPGWIQFGYASTTWLDYREMNSAGYPSPGKSCAASPDADGECGGYMYRQFENTTSVYTNTAYYKFDVQEGQSGAPIYDYDGDDERTVYILHKGSVGNYAYGKRLRSGSFGTICDWIGNWPSSHFSDPSC